MFTSFSGCPCQIWSQMRVLKKAYHFEEPLRSCTWALSLSSLFALSYKGFSLVRLVIKLNGEHSTSTGITLVLRLSPSCQRTHAPTLKSLSALPFPVFCQNNRSVLLLFNIFEWMEMRRLYLLVLWEICRITFPGFINWLIFVSIFLSNSCLEQITVWILVGFFFLFLFFAQHSTPLEMFRLLLVFVSFSKRNHTNLCLFPSCFPACSQWW